MIVDKRDVDIDYDVSLFLIEDYNIIDYDR